MRKELENLPLIKNYSSRKEWEVACWEEIMNSKVLLKLLVTQHERHNLVMRASARKCGLRTVARSFIIYLFRGSLQVKEPRCNSSNPYGYLSNCGQFIQDPSAQACP